MAPRERDHSFEEHFKLPYSRFDDLPPGVQEEILRGETLLFIQTQNRQEENNTEVTVTSDEEDGSQQLDTNEDDDYTNSDTVEWNEEELSDPDSSPERDSEDNALGDLVLENDNEYEDDYADSDTVEWNEEGSPEESDCSSDRDSEDNALGDLVLDNDNEYEDDVNTASETTLLEAGLASGAKWLRSLPPSYGNLDLPGQFGADYTNSDTTETIEESDYSSDRDLEDRALSDEDSTYTNSNPDQKRKRKYADTSDERDNTKRRRSDNEYEDDDQDVITGTVTPLSPSYYGNHNLPGQFEASTNRSSSSNRRQHSSPAEDEPLQKRKRE